MTSIVGYKSELSYLKLAPKPVFITETGWDQTKLKGATLAQNWSTAWQIWQNDPNVVAVTPFILQGGEQFKQFSLYKPDGEYSASGQSIYNLPKSSGSPKQVEAKPELAQGTPAKDPSWVMPFFKSSHALLKLENIFRVIMGLPVKSTITLKDIPLMVETAQTAKQWEKGLSDRLDLGIVDGMLFIFTSPHVPLFWMKGMHFPIDIIWLSGDKVVDLTLSAPVETSDQLPTYSPRSPIDMALEVRAGWAEVNGITVGDTLTIND